MSERKGAGFDEMACRLANLYRSIGLQPGHHVAMCLENRVEFLALAWGARYAGLYYTAISSRLTAEELGYIVEDSGSIAMTHLGSNIWS